MSARAIVTVSVLGMLSGALVWAQEHAPAAYKLEIGPHKVQTVKELVLRDEKRNKDLHLRINHPDGKGPFPVIVWSHGATATKEHYLPLTEFWASHGYVTIQANHSDSGKRDDPKRFQDWQSRPADISFILDSLEELEKKEPALKGKFDPKRIGVGGHSFGANTSQLIGGAKAFVREGEKSFEDKRVTAVALLSGQGPGEMLTEKSWEKFAKPMLVMTGSKDGPTRTGQPAEWRKKPYELSPPGDKYLVWVEGLDHEFGGGAFGGGGITGDGIPLPKRVKLNEDHVKYTKIVTLAYWDAYLKESKEARAYLESDQLPKFSKGTLQLEHK